MFKIGDRILVKKAFMKKQQSSRLGTVVGLSCTGAILYRYDNYDYDEVAADSDHDLNEFPDGLDCHFHPPEQLMMYIDPNDLWKKLNETR